MGRRGPMPKPTQLRVLEGNPSHRPLPKGEVKPPAVMPPVPEWLDADGRKEWRRVAPQLHKLGLLTEIDGHALGRYCLAMASLLKAQAVLEAKGFTVSTPSGYKQQRPEVAIVRNMLLITRAYAIEFGMTPSARTRIHMPEEGADDDVDDLLG